MQVDLTLVELRDLKVLASLVPKDDARLDGVGCVVSNRRAVWFATDNGKLVSVARGQASTDGTGAVPLREFLIACQIAESRNLPASIIFNAENSSGTVWIEDFALDFAKPSEPFSSILESSAVQPTGDCEVTVSAARLLEAVEASTAESRSTPRERRKNFLLYANATTNSLIAHASWLGRADTRARVSCQCTINGVCSVDPEELRTVVSLAGDTVVKLTIGQSAEVPLRSSMVNGVELIVMPAAFGVERERSAFEEVLLSVRDGADGTLDRDEDGDYVLPLRTGETAWIRLVAGEANRKIPDYVSIFMTIVEGVNITPAALAEINAQNRRFPFARLYAGDNLAQLSTHVVLEDITPTQLRASIEILADIAETMGPLMKSYFEEAE